MSVIDSKVVRVRRIKFVSQYGEEMPKRQRMTAEVEHAVKDILYGTSVDSHTEWLQREYIRLMRRECEFRRNDESKLKETSTGNDNDGKSA